MISHWKQQSPHASPSRPLVIWEQLDQGVKPLQGAMSDMSGSVAGG